MTRVLLAEDHGLVRDGLRSILAGRGDFEVVGEASDGREAVRLALQFTPDLALVDVAMPKLNGIEAARQIRRGSPGTRVLMVSMQTGSPFVYEALQAGASGYVLKQDATDELLEAVRRVLAGEMYLSPGVAGEEVLRALRTPRPGPPGTELERLAGREREVLQLVAEGHSGVEIAAELKLSPRTVETYRQRIMLKLNLHSIADLTRFAVRNGLCGAER